MSNTKPNEDELIEYFENDEELDKKAKGLAKLITESKHFIIFTGAGLSTCIFILDSL